MSSYDLIPFLFPRLPDARARRLLGGRVRADAPLLGVRAGEAAALPPDIHHHRQHLQQITSPRATQLAHLSAMFPR